MRLPTANALSVYDNVHVYAEDCIAKRGTDPVTKKQVLTHCCAATGSIVGVSEFSFGLFSYFSPPFGIYRRAFVFAKRGTDPVTKKQVLTHCCAATGSSVGVTEFSFGLFSYFSSPSGIYRRAFVSLVRLYQVFPRASVSSLYFFLHSSYSNSGWLN